MRDWLNRFGVLIVVVALIGGVLVYYVLSRGEKPASASGTKAYYMDEETGDESIFPVTAVPPVVGKDGKATVVQAIKYSCDGGKTTKVAYLQKYTAEAKEALDRMYKTGEQPTINTTVNTLVRSPEKGSQWYSSQSNEGESLMGRFECPEGKAEIVRPPQ